MASAAVRGAEMVDAPRTANYPPQQAESTIEKPLREDAASDARPGGGDEPATTPVDPAGQPGTYRVSLDVFEGPFDLLLQLISRRKLEVSEVDLAEITAEFLDHLRLDDENGGVGGLDLDTATHFLVVAATLVELKAARLLPEPERQGLEDLLADARDVLYARLLEYKGFRDASALLGARLDVNAGHVPREVALEERFRALSPDTDLSVDAAGIAALAAAALAAPRDQRVSVAHIQTAVMSLREAARHVLARLRQPGERAVFSALTAGLSRMERIMHFLAVLELYKLGHVDLEQEERFGPVGVRRVPATTDLGEIAVEGGGAG